MSKVAPVRVVAGALNARASLNTAFTSWDTATATVDESNIRQEGIDRRNIDFDADIFHKVTTAAWTNTIAPLAIQAAGTLATSPIVDDSGNNVMVAFSHTAHQNLSGLVRCSFEVYTTVVPSSRFPEVEAGLVYSASGSGSWSVLATAPSGNRKLRQAKLGGTLRGQLTLLLPILDKTSGYIGLVAKLRQYGTGANIEGEIENVVLSVEAYGG